MTKFVKIKPLINLVHVYNRAKIELNSYTKLESTRSTLNGYMKYIILVHIIRKSSRGIWKKCRGTYINLNCSNINTNDISQNANRWLSI